MILSERKKDAVLVAVYSYSGLILSFIYSSLFIRFDGGELYGIYAHALAILSFIVVALGFGFQVGLVKINISLEKYRSIATTTMLFWGTVVLAGMFFYFVAYYESKFSSSFLLVIAAGCAALTELIAVVWQWMKKIVAFRGYVVLRSLINISLVSLLIYELINIELFLILLALFSILHFTFLVIKSGAISIFHDFSFNKENYNEIKTNLWSQSKFFWASLLAVAVYGKVGIVMLKFFSFSNIEIGRYAYLYTIMAALLILPSAIQTYLMRPLFAKDMDGSSVLKKILPIYIIIGATCSYLFWKELPVVIELIIGKSSDLVEIYWAFAPTILIVYIANLLGMALMTEGKEKERAIIQWGSAISHILLTIILIPSFGLKGAALATTGSYFLLLLGFLYVNLKHNIWNSRKFSLSLVAIAIISISFYYYEQLILLPLLIAVWLLIKQYISSKSFR